MLDTTPRSGTAAELLPPIYDTDAILADLPRQLEPWPNAQSSTKITTCLRRAQKYGGWAWPSKPVVFISDPHADAESFLRSLQAAGVIRRDFGAAGPISLTDFGKTCRIILGGDSLDKGPSNLAMLDALGQISSLEADLHILAGNHDLRMRMVVEALRGPRSALTDHLFVRMGRKILPALGEVFDHFVTAADMARLPDEVACRERLLPGPDWETRFAHAARDILRPKLLRQEIAKLKNRQAMLDQEIIRLGLSHRQILAAAWKCQEVFFQPGGAYAWFYDRMDVVTRAGSLLFVHAGLCD
ncbi:MAG: metallophosphoesterase, partial [Mangrovicoccus sp.]